jgi:hypothetical protein
LVQKAAVNCVLSWLIITTTTTYQSSEVYKQAANPLKRRWSSRSCRFGCLSCRCPSFINGESVEINVYVTLYNFLRINKTIKFFYIFFLR